MRSIVRFLFVLLLLLTISSAALACTCAGTRAPCQSYWEAKAVFVGTVIDGKEVTFKRQGYTESMLKVRFSIDEGFRGAEGAQIEVLTGYGGGDCGFGFRQSKQYLVYAYDDDGTLVTGVCTRTKAIEKAADDLAFIRGLPNAKPGATVTVSVVKATQGPNSKYVETPQRGLGVTIEGGQQRNEYKTNAKGLVHLEGLSPGKYKVTLSLPPGLMVPEPMQEIDVADRGCANIHYYVQTDGRLSGRVISATGFPVANAQIYLSEADKGRYQGYGDFAQTDEKGNYSFRRIPPGRYVLAIRYDGKTDQTSPFPLTYFPGTPNKADAQVVAFTEGQSIEQFDLTMPPLPTEYEIEGTVQSLAGEQSNVEYRIPDQSYGYSAEVKDGKFKFKAYEGLRLQIRATQKLGESKWGASTTVDVTVVAGLPALKLVITPQP